MQLCKVAGNLGIQNVRGSTIMNLNISTQHIELLFHTEMFIQISSTTIVTKILSIAADVPPSLLAPFSTVLQTGALYLHPPGSRQPVLSGSRLFCQALFNLQSKKCIDSYLYGTLLDKLNVSLKLGTSGWACNLSIPCLCVYNVHLDMIPILPDLLPPASNLRS